MARPSARRGISRLLTTSSLRKGLPSFAVPDSDHWQFTNDPPTKAIDAKLAVIGGDALPTHPSAGFRPRCRGICGPSGNVPMAGHRQRRTSGGPDRGAVSSHETIRRSHLCSRRACSISMELFQIGEKSDHHHPDTGQSRRRRRFRHHRILRALLRNTASAAPA